MHAYCVTHGTQTDNCDEALPGRLSAHRNMQGAAFLPFVEATPHHGQPAHLLAHLLEHRRDVGAQQRQRQRCRGEPQELPPVTRLQGGNTRTHVQGRHEPSLVRHHMSSFPSQG